MFQELVLSGNLTYTTAVQQVISTILFPTASENLITLFCFNTLKKKIQFEFCFNNQPKLFYKTNMHKNYSPVLKSDYYF